MINVHPLAPGSHGVLVHGIEQRYHVFGQGPICLVHSGGPGVNWDYMRMPRLEEHLTLVYVEPIGTGGSGRLPDHPHGYTVDRYADQLHGLADALSLDRVLVMGHSHGGFVAQRFAIDHPERVTGLLLYATSAFTGDDFMADAARGVDRFVNHWAGTPEAVSVLRGWRSPRDSDEAYTASLRDLLPVYFADFQGVDIEALRDSLHVGLVKGDDAPFDVRLELPDLRVPALVIVGAHDFICGPRWSDTLVDLIPDARCAAFDNAGHFVHLECPYAFADAVVAFVHQDVRAAA